MRSTAMFAVFLTAVAIAAIDTNSANALSPSEYFSPPPGVFIEFPMQLESEETQALAVVAEPAEKSNKPKREPQIKHVVASGETLIGIADSYDTKWQRIFHKNKGIKDPHALKVGQKLIIPTAEEKLKKRPIPEPVVPAPAPRQSSYTAPVAAPVVTATTRGSSAGNTYYYGYCTWYAKNRRPDLPNNLGNADTWTIRAAGQGFATGSTPRVGAIAQQGMHVAYVEKVHANGNVTLSEMNFVGWNIISTRTVPANNFNYIYR